MTSSIYDAPYAMGSPSSASQTLYMPIASPPTPAPSPGPHAANHIPMIMPNDPQAGTVPLTLNLTRNPTLRRQYLSALLTSCTPEELLFISTTIAPLLKRDFLFGLPPELSLHIISFIDDPKTLGRAMQVSKHWHKLVGDDSVWKRMSRVYEFGNDGPDDHVGCLEGGGKGKGRAVSIPREKRRRSSAEDYGPSLATPYATLSPQQYFKFHHTIMMNWRHGGRLLRSHRVPAVSNNPDISVITSISLDKDWVVVGLANSRIHVFSASTGVLARTLVGHELGVWAVCLVTSGGRWGGPRRRRRRSRQSSGAGSAPDDDISRFADIETLSAEGDAGHIPSILGAGMGLGAEDEDEDELFDEDTEDLKDAHPGRPSYVTGASEGWGQRNSLVVSGGCDKVLRVWDAKSGYCLYILQGHTSTIRCIKVLHNRPIAVSGSRDTTLRVWDIRKGKMLRVLSGHQSSVRCLDVCGNRVVSGSYDTTCRVWDVDTGECLHVLSGHFHQLYSVAFDGVHIASGGLDTTVRLWDAETGDCLATLSGHTALVCQLQLSPTMLATGGSDGRVITFSLTQKPYPVLHRIAAHDSSVTSLQFDSHFLVTGGNDGRVRLFETKTGAYIRELSEASESVWKVAYNYDTLAVMCRRAGKTVMEIWSLKPKDDA
ncbi:WD40 repeat-like protein [Hymenopellis radicata]|nr:WD40 repeat-like protein [Hymenopellis radicata]